MESWNSQHTEHIENQDEGNDVDFPQDEIRFYAIAVVVSGVACFARILRDNEPIERRNIVGRCMSSSVLGCGAVAIWLGNHPTDTGNGGFYWLAVCALIGYCSRDIQDQILSRLVGWLLKRFGGDDVVGK